MSHATFHAGELTAVIGDNAAHGNHRAGYNGVRELRHRRSTRSLFVPGIAGLNLEHIFNGDDHPAREVFFEPRFAPMTFRRISDTECELHQPPTPTFHLESWSRFQLVAPHYLDLTFTCRATQHVFHRGWVGLFWASYLNAPEDKSLYFRGGLEGQKNLWSQLCTHAHNDESTVLHREDRLNLDCAPGRETLFKNFSPLRYDEPFYYGNFEDLNVILMFDRPGEVRFTHSPSGGGANRELETTNPAWDFQWIISPYEVLKINTLRVRMVVRPKCPREAIEAEYRAWQKLIISP